jgi:Ca2+-binding RTX toxin-like protein
VNTLSGIGGADTLDGGLGHDVLIGGLGGDTLIGGAGVDTASYQAAKLGVAASLAAPESNTNEAAGDSYNGIENLTGSVHVDSLTGNALANTLNGLGGVDTLAGGLGNDALNGGLGNDNLTGGAGFDAFVFNTAIGAANLDQITDFSVADDTVRLDDAIFTGLARGVLSSAAFHIGMAAGAADDRIIYNSAPELCITARAALFRSSLPTLFCIRLA